MTADPNSHSASPDAADELDGVHNFRPLPRFPLADGGQLRSGRIYRSGALDLATQTDIAYLSALGLGTILDLRHPDELLPEGIAHGLRERVRHLSIFPVSSTQEEIIAELNGRYGVGISPERYLHYLGLGGARFAEAFELFADDANYPILVHCTAGKDRTGVLLALVLEVVGVTHAEIAADYGRSDAAIPRLIAFMERTGRKPEGTPEELFRRFTTPPEKMTGFLALLGEHHGGAAAYLRNQGVSDATITRVRELLTER